VQVSSKYSIRFELIFTFFGFCSYNLIQCKAIGPAPNPQPRRPHLCIYVQKCQGWSLGTGVPFHRDLRLARLRLRRCNLPRHARHFTRIPGSRRLSILQQRTGMFRWESRGHNRADEPCGTSCRVRGYSLCEHSSWRWLFNHSSIRGGQLCSYEVKGRQRGYVSVFLRSSRWRFSRSSP
jgi:hypothetical protein